MVGAGQVGARPPSRKRARIAASTASLLHDDESGQSKQIIFSVKAGGVSVPQVRDLIGVLSARKPRSASSFRSTNHQTMLAKPPNPALQINRRHHLSPPANPHHPADSGRQATGVPLHRRDATFKKPAQPPRRRSKLTLPFCPSSNLRGCSVRVPRQVVVRGVRSDFGPGLVSLTRDSRPYSCSRLPLLASSSSVFPLRAQSRRPACSPWPRHLMQPDKRDRAPQLALLQPESTEGSRQSSPISPPLERPARADLRSKPV